MQQLIVRGHEEGAHREPSEHQHGEGILMARRRKPGSRIDTREKAEQQDRPGKGEVGREMGEDRVPFRFIPSGGISDLRYEGVRPFPVQPEQSFGEDRDRIGKTEEVGPLPAGFQPEAQAIIALGKIAEKQRKAQAVVLAKNPE